MELTITKTIKIDNQLIDDLIVTALEGGINYWTSKVEVQDGDYKGGEFASDVISRGGTLIIHVPDAFKKTKFKLNLENFEVGIRSFMEKYPDVDLNDDYDAGDADLIMQFALFGEIVFG